MAQGSLNGGTDNGFFQQLFQTADKGKGSAAFDKKLDDTGILTAGPVQNPGKLLIFNVP